MNKEIRAEPNNDEGVRTPSENMKNKFYSGKKVLSYNTPFIFSLGNRSIGKTFYWTCRMINYFKETGRKFLYVRRYDDDLRAVGTKIFDAVRFKFPTDELEVRGSGKTGTEYYINGELAGMTFALSLAYKAKSISLPDYDIIFFDEFLPENGRYLSNEVEMALNLYQTVARGDGKAIREDCKFIFIANNVTLNNPYFKELHIRENIKTGSHYIVDKDRAWVLELTNNVAIADEIAKTAFGKMIAKTRYGDYALKSQFLMDDSTFIEKPSGNSRYYCTLVWRGKEYGVFEYTDAGVLQISSKVDKSCKLIFSLSTADHKPNYMLLYKSRQNPVYAYLRFCYNIAAVRFDNDDCKIAFLEIMEYQV